MVSVAHMEGSELNAGSGVAMEISFGQWSTKSV